MRRYPQRSFALPADAREVILVRHGASAPAVRGEPFPALDGHGDPPLAPEGEIQAAAVGARLAGEPLAGLFVSGLRRTVQTAAPLRETFALDPVVVPELREVYLGDWEGGEFRIRMAEGDEVALRTVTEERWDVIPNAESMEVLADRTRRGIERIVSLTAGGTTVAAVVHGGIIGEICRQATGSRPFAFVHSDNASISRLVVLGDGRWLLRSFNDTAHLNP